MSKEKVKVGIVMGSDSDLPVMRQAAEILEELGVGSRMVIASAHRTPEKAMKFVRDAEADGIEVIIAGAGKAAHLPGVIASWTTLPVIGVPMKTSDLGGVDSLYSIVQMPSGIPVASMAINGAKNAGIFAAQILALKYADVREALADFRDKLSAEVEEKDARLQEKGVEQYLNQ